jgi:5S rRNA maturation endonuclease (ribonuclease M5)
MSEVLTLADLEAFDPQAPLRAPWRRFCCPLPACSGKPLDDAHRTLCVQTETGSWHCKRCPGKGRLREYWDNRPARPGRYRPRLQRLGALPPPPLPSAPPIDMAPTWLDRWERSSAILGTPGADYLAGRGISPQVAAAAGVRFAASWPARKDDYRPGIVFPLRDPQRVLKAVEIRYIDGREDPKAQTNGPKKQGAFITPGALDAPILVLVEGPADALALASCGVPAVALMGTETPVWLSKLAMFRSVALALDADEVGDSACGKINQELTRFGCKIQRWRPVGHKDWAEVVEHEGTAALTASLAELVRAEGRRSEQHQVFDQAPLGL